MTIVTSDTIKAISAALLTFQGAVDGVGKTAENTAFKSSGKVFKYATLENVRDTAVPELQKVGVFFIQSAGAIVDGVMAMTTRLVHAESGEWIEATMDICLGKRDPQGVGSAVTYCSRYHLMSMLGLPPIDDDGEAAIDRNNQRPTAVIQKPVKGNIEPPEEMSNTAAKAHWKTIADEMYAAKTLVQLQGVWTRHYRIYEQLPENLQNELSIWKDELKGKLMDEDTAKKVRLAQTP